MRSASPRSPAPPDGDGAADPVVGHLDPEGPVDAVEADGHPTGAGVLQGVGQPFGDDEVGGALDGVGQSASLPSRIRSVGSGREGDEVLGRRVQAALDEQGGHEAVDQPAQLGRRGVELAAQLGRASDDFGRGSVDLGQQTRPEREEHQLRLQPVVEVLGDPPALVVTGLDDAGAGLFQLARAHHELGGEAFALEGEGRDLARALHVPGVGDQGGVVDDPRHGPRADVHRSRPPAGPRVLDVEGSTGPVDRASVGHRVDHLQGRVTEGLGEREVDAGPTGRLRAETDRQRVDLARRREAATLDAPRERQRDACEQDDLEDGDEVGVKVHGACA